MNLEQQLKQTLELPEAMPEEAGAYDRFLRQRRRRTRAVAAGAGLTLILLLTVAVTAPRLLAGRDRSAVGAGGQARPGRLVRVAMEPWWACVWTAGAWSCAFPVAPGRAGRALRTGL